MAHRFREWNLDCKIYIGNLSEQASKHDLESALMKYGHLKNVWVARNPPGFAFVEFEDARDAEDAVRALDGSRICGSRIRVEKSHGRSKRNPQPRGRGFGARRDNGRYYPSGGNRRSRSRERHESYNRSRGRSRSRTRSPPARRGRYSRSRSRSPSDRHSLPRSPRSPRSPPPRSPISPRRSPMNGKSPHSRGDSRSRSRSITPNRD